MLELVALISLQILAVWVCLQDGMIFGWVRRSLARKIPTFLHKPLFECLTCMGGCWGLVFYLMDRAPYPLVDIVPAVIGLNYLISLYKDQFFIPIHGEDNKG